MKKLTLTAISILSLAGCASLKYNNIEVSKADEMTLCDVAYNGIDWSTKNRGKLEIEMRGDSWDSHQCRMFAESEQRRRAQTGANHMIIKYEEEHFKKQDIWKKEQKHSIDNGKLPAENDKGEIELKEAVNKIIGLFN
jgi:hypothetical protein